MNPQNKLLGIAAGVIGFLILATIIGQVLRRRITTESGRTVIGNMNTRINAWWMMVAILGAAFLIGKIAVIVLFAFISYFSLREFITLTPTRKADHKTLSLAFFIILPVQYYLIGIGWYNFFAIFIPVYAFLILPSVAAIGEDTEQFLERSAKIQWGIFVSIYCISHAPALLLLTIPGYAGQNFLLVIYLILVVQLSDVLQYVFGKLFGKTKIAPIVSPAKTVEGFIGGAGSTILIGAALWWMTPFKVWQSAGMAFLIVIMGFLGGLVFSAVKRSMGAKDWGTMIKGHGGMLDRLDSLSFAAPIFFHITRYFFTP